VHEVPDATKKGIRNVKVWYIDHGCSWNWNLLIVDSNFKFSGEFYILLLP